MRGGPRARHPDDDDASRTYNWHANRLQSRYRWVDTLHSSLRKSVCGICAIRHSSDRLRAAGSLIAALPNTDEKITAIRIGERDDFREQCISSVVDNMTFRMPRIWRILERNALLKLELLILKCANGAKFLQISSSQFRECFTQSRHVLPPSGDAVPPRMLSCVSISTAHRLEQVVSRGVGCAF